MNPFISQTALPASNTTADFLRGSPISNWKGAIFGGSMALSNNAQTAGADFTLGATDGVRNVVFAMSAADATAGGRSRQYISTTECIARIVPSTGTISLKAAYDSVQANGVRVLLSANTGSNPLYEALQYTGTDIEFACDGVLYSSSDTTKTYTTHLTAPFDGLIMVAANGIASFGSTSEARFSIGFHDGTNAAAVAFNHTTLSNPTTLAARATADLGHGIVALADNWTWSINNITATTFDLNRTAAAGATVAVIIIAWRAVGLSKAALASLVNLPTSTGTAAMLTGMAVKPQVAFFLPTRLIDTNLDTDDSTGSISFGMACNDSGSIEQGAVATTDKDNVATGVAKSYIDNTLSIDIADTSVAIVHKATLSTFDNVGISLNHNPVSGSATKCPVMAYGIAAPGTIAPVPRKRRIVNTTFYPG